MKMTNRLSGVLALALGAGVLLSACGGSGEESGQAGSATASVSPGATGSASSANGPKIALEAFLAGWGLALPGDNFVKRELDQALNTDLNLTLVTTADEFIQKLNLRAAGNELPDIIRFPGKNEYQEYAKRGLLLDLTPYMNKLGDVKALIGEDVFQRGKIGDKAYSITLNPTTYYNVPWVRKDWLDHLGLPVPKTLDELLEVSKAFTTRDPDGNGKNDTFGLTADLSAVTGMVMPLHGVANGLYLKNGQMVHGLYQPEMKDAVGYIKKMIDSGSLDPEIASNKGTISRDKAFQGKAGILVTNWTGIMKDEEIKKWKDANPKAEWIMISDLKGPGGDFMATKAKSATSGYMAVPKSIEKNPAKLEKIWELFNYTAKGDGLNLVQFGLKDVHYKLDNGKISLTDKASETAYTWVYQFSGRPESSYLSAKFPAQVPYIEANDRVKAFDTYSSYVTLPDGYNAADADRFKEEELLKFYFGKNKLDTFDAFLSKLDTTFKYQIYIDSALKQLGEMGFIK
ncbi:extracellular solute-binding protein [Paenibacillus sp. YN15]|uniref:extracellular solute-binding protein n=1 Tax=Paenibacillus sp. YN15 TaxID=1742774 RepID=UPI000DCD707F|nr:extracellular solute-binding protein [Paenibacillus sp. YN15]RAU93312.1 ABC transporter substrate-binding protein [Paenibacillus sp. YN15]